MTDGRPPRIPTGFFSGASSDSSDKRAANRARRERLAKSSTSRSSRGVAASDSSGKRTKAASPPRKRPAHDRVERSTARSAPRRQPARARAAGDDGRARRPPSKSAKSHGPSSSHGRRRPRAASPRVRYLGVGAVFCVMLSLTVAKLTDLQVLSPDRYRSAGVTQRTVRVALPSGRGAILDRNGADLAVSVPRSTVVADPTQVSDLASEATLLGRILKADRTDVAKLLKTDSRFVYIDRLITPAAADEISRLKDAGRLDGVDLITEYERVRPNGDEAQSLVGLTDIDSAGISGLEKQYESVLQGSPGEVSYERSAMGPIPGGERQIKAASPGDDLELSIDLPLQYAAEKLVGAQVRATGSESGIAIISRPSTGEVLSMVNMVADEKTGRVSPSTNNEALTTVFEPGSVNKVITVAAALAAGEVTPATVLEHPSTLSLGGATFGEAESLPSSLSVTDILTVSSNVGTIKMAQMLGKHKVDAALRDFGFGRSTALNFPNESAGLLLAPADWSGSSIGSIPIGQGISVTAMQMLQAYNVIANGGVAVEPRLVNATIDAQGRRHPTATSKERRVIPAETARQLRGILANVVQTGTGTKAAVPGYQVAGKTGTARKPLDKHQPGDGYLGLDGRYHYVSSFVGMLPAGDPQLSIIVILNDPDGSYYASDTAAPLFGQLATEAVRRLHIPPTTGPDATQGLPAVNPDLLAVQTQAAPEGAAVER